MPSWHLIRTFTVPETVFPPLSGIAAAAVVVVSAGSDSTVGGGSVLCTAAGLTGGGSESCTAAGRPGSSDGGASVSDTAVAVCCTSGIASSATLWREYGMFLYHKIQTTQNQFGFSSGVEFDMFYKYVVRKYCG